MLHRAVCNGDGLAELELLKHSDNAAAKMVSCYLYVQFPLSHLSFPPIRRSSLPHNGGHATMGTSVPRRAPHGNDIHVAHSTRLSAGRARYGTVPGSTPARCPGEGDGATRARDIWPSVLDCAAAGDCRAEDQLTSALRRWMHRGLGMVVCGTVR